MSTGSQTRNLQLNSFVCLVKIIRVANYIFGHAGALGRAGIEAASRSFCVKIRVQLIRMI
jgi:hypothetical protein